MREICTSGSMRGEAATMVTLVPPLLLYWLDFSAASLAVSLVSKGSKTPYTL